MKSAIVVGLLVTSCLAGRPDMPKVSSDVTTATKATLMSPILPRQKSVDPVQEPRSVVVASQQPVQKTPTPIPLIPAPKVPTKVAGATPPTQLPKEPTPTAPSPEQTVQQAPTPMPSMPAPKAPEAAPPLQLPVRPRAQAGPEPPTLSQEPTQFLDDIDDEDDDDTEDENLEERLMEPLENIAGGLLPYWGFPRRIGWRYGRRRAYALGWPNPFAYPFPLRYGYFNYHNGRYYY